MVQATDFGDGNDPAEVPPLNWPAVGCILVEREVSARPVVVREVAGEGAAQVPFAEDEDVIQTLAPNRPDEPLREGILPGAVSRREDFPYAHALHALAERVAVDGVAIAEKKGRAESSGNASTICWAVQAAVGCSVTLTRDRRRRAHHLA